jgi:hypothetical protein
MISRSIYNRNIDTAYTYDIPIERGFHQLSNGIRHVMPSTDRRLELKAKDIDGSDRLCINGPSEPGRLTDGCVCQWVKDAARYTPGNNSLLGSNTRPFEVVGTLTIFCVLSFKVSLNGSVLIALGLGSKFTTSLFIIIWHEQ